MQPTAIYRLLLRAYGPQNWWPVTDKGGIKPSYRARKKLSERQRFEVAVGAILTQNNSWLNVMRSIEELNKAGLVSPQKILSTDKRKLMRLIKSSRYFAQKAGYLKNFSGKVLAWGSIKKLFSLPLPDLRRELLSVKGIGNETADAVILYAAGKPSFVVDAFTVRIVERMRLADDARYTQLKQWFEDRLPKDAALLNEFHALLDEHAKTVCTKSNPGCPGCVLRKNCAYALGKTGKLTPCGGKG